MLALPRVNYQITYVSRFFVRRGLPAKKLLVTVTDQTIPDEGKNNYVKIEICQLAVREFANAVDGEHV
jgi:hypothetical protein